MLAEVAAFVVDDEVGFVAALVVVDAADFVALLELVVDAAEDVLLAVAPDDVEVAEVLVLATLTALLDEAALAPVALP